MAPANAQIAVVLMVALLASTSKDGISTRLASADATASADAANDNAGGDLATKTIVDMRGRSVDIPANVEKIVCVSITLRQVSYLGAQDMVIGVEEGEHKDYVAEEAA